MADAVALNSMGHGAAGARTDGSSSTSHGANRSPREDQRTHGWVQAGTSRACMATGAQHTRPPASPPRTTLSRRSATLRSPSPRKDSAEFTLKPSPSSSNSKSEYRRSSSITLPLLLPRPHRPRRRVHRESPLLFPLFPPLIRTRS